MQESAFYFHLTPERKRERQCTLVYRKLEPETWEVKSVTLSYMTMGKTGQGADTQHFPNMTHPSASRSLFYPSIQSLSGRLVLLKISVKSEQQKLLPCVFTDCKVNPPQYPHPCNTTPVTQPTHSCNQDKTVRVP